MGELKLTYTPPSIKGKEEIITGINPENCFLQLLEDRLHYRVMYEFEQYIDFDNKALGREIVKVNHTIATKKENVVGVERWRNKHCWHVGININGFSDDIRMIFLKFEDATKVYDSMYEWLFKK